MISLKRRRWFLCKSSEYPYLLKDYNLLCNILTHFFFCSMHYRHISFFLIFIAIISIILMHFFFSLMSLLFRFQYSIRFVSLFFFYIYYSMLPHSFTSIYSKSFFLFFAKRYTIHFFILNFLALIFFRLYPSSHFSCLWHHLSPPHHSPFARRTECNDTCDFLLLVLLLIPLFSLW